MKEKTVYVIDYKKRLIFEVFMAIIYNTMLTLTLYSDRPFSWRGHLFSIVLFIFIGEGIFLFNQLIANKYPWHTETRRRVIGLMIFSGIWFFVSSQLGLLIKPFVDQKVEVIDPNIFHMTIILAIVFVYIFAILLIAYNYHQSLSYFLLENKRLEQERLQMDYHALQDQINPHFLFNNLSTLIAIIRSDKNAAIRFAENFSDVYRYVLQSKDKTSIRLEDELIFIKAYLALHQERLGAGLKVKIEISDLALPFHLPPLSLQFLVENAIKHNIATIQKPLNIHVYTQDKKIIVKNNLNYKKSTYSTHTGLKNLSKRYSFLTDKELVICKENDFFRVEAPLIRLNNEN